MLISRSEENSSAAIEAAATTASAGNIRFYSADATRPRSLESAIATINRELGEVELLICNPRGGFAACNPLDIPYAVLEDVYRVEVIGAFAVAKPVLPGMIKWSRGAVFVSSATAAFRGSSTYPLFAIDKFRRRTLSQSLSKAYAKNGVHIVHFRLDCELDAPIIRDLYGEEYDPVKLVDPDDVAETYRLTYLQPSSAWSNEVEIRPHTEAWTY